MVDVAYIALGSNLGDRAAHLAIARARRWPRFPTVDRDRRVVDRRDRAARPDCAGAVSQSDDRAWRRRSRRATCSSHLHDIEAREGRTRDARWGPRTIDLDIVCFDRQTVDDPDLRVPHRRASESRLLAARARRAARRCEDSHDATATSRPAFELPPWAQVSEKRASHIVRVTALLAEWADAMQRLRRRATSRGSTPAGFTTRSRTRPTPSCARSPATSAYEPQMLHGPAAAARLERDGETRRGRARRRAVSHDRLSRLGSHRTRALHGGLSRAGTELLAARSRVSRRAGAARLRRRLSRRSCARGSSGRCTKGTRSFRKPSRSGTRSDEAGLDRRRRHSLGRSCSSPARSSRDAAPSAATPSASDARAVAACRAPGRRRAFACRCSTGRRRAGSRVARRCCCAIAASTCVEIGNDRPTTRDTTLVLDLSGHPEWAKRVAQVLGAGARRSAPRQLTLPGYRRRSWVAPGARRPSRSTRS